VKEGIFIGVIGGIILSIIASAFKYFWNSRKKQRAIKGFKLIKAWYDYIDANLNDLNMDMINNLESEVDLFFSSLKNKKLTLRFDKRFRRRIVREIGLKKEFWNSPEEFRIYARLNREYIPLIIKLKEASSKKKVKLTKFPFDLYWGIIKGNFYKFHEQFRIEYKGIPLEKKYIWTEVENPICLISKLYGDN
jgi:hypothetical protein